jgi:hypothetical protein
METLDHLNRERGQSKAPKRSAWAKMLRRALTVRVLFALAPLLTKVVQLGIELLKALRQ